jgi:hypothetical protein
MLYPPGVRHWLAWTRGDGLFRTEDACTGPILSVIGDLNLLSRSTVGLLCSVRCPGRIILDAYDFARRTPQDGAAIIGGFHSPMERTCLNTLLARHVPVVYCPARRLIERDPRAGCRTEEQQLLILCLLSRSVASRFRKTTQPLHCCAADVLCAVCAAGHRSSGAARYSGMSVCTLQNGERASDGSGRARLPLRLPAWRVRRTEPSCRRKGRRAILLCGFGHLAAGVPPAPAGVLPGSSRSFVVGRAGEP